MNEFILYCKLTVLVLIPLLLLVCCGLAIYVHRVGGI